MAPTYFGVKGIALPLQTSCSTQICCLLVGVNLIIIFKKNDFVGHLTSPIHNLITIFSLDSIRALACIEVEFGALKVPYHGMARGIFYIIGCCCLCFFFMLLVLLYFFLFFKEISSCRDA